MSAPYGAQRRPPAERRFDGAREADDERMIVGHLGRAEAAAEHLDRHRMLTQPPVGSAGGRDRGPQLGLRLGR